MDLLRLNALNRYENRFFNLFESRTSRRFSIGVLRAFQTLPMLPSSLH